MKILMSGATGKMGRMIFQMLEQSKQHQIIAGFAVELDEKLPFPIYLNLEECQETDEIEMIIDFSSPNSLADLLNFALANKKPIILASTGYSAEQEEQIKKASKSIPILHSKNMSLGINVMQMLVERMAAALSDFDIEIIEKHHRYKKDSPSGTAKMLFESVNKGRDNKLTELDGRAGMYDSREINEVGVSALRGGTIVGEHSVIFAGEDEILEIKHTANSRAIFANGAIKAAEFLLDQKPGFYTMNDVL
ncbi:MAG: 4-hydroxy-tetrahydrodipicolinate reductase [Clostridiaceae bacterium]|nr:4-hydroxy-tetrahydrodipicolinate reductase [Clostridiaceae bacterium]